MSAVDEGAVLKIVQTGDPVLRRPARDLTPENWATSLKQHGSVQAYVVQTPDSFEVIEQETPRFRRGFATLEQALKLVNERYGTWERVDLEAHL